MCIRDRPKKACLYYHMGQCLAPCEQAIDEKAVSYTHLDVYKRQVLRPGIVHRIDKDTTGLLIVAKNDKAHTALSKQLQNKTVNRL